MDDNMDIDMDIDLVVDEEEDEEVARLRAQAEAARTMITEPETGAGMAGAQEMGEEGEVPDVYQIPTKVFMSGLDLLNTNDVRNFVGDNHTLDNFVRVEWIDDTSANLIFKSDTAASEALQALTREGDSFNGDTALAKPLVTHPNAEMRVRLSTSKDAKQPGAKDRSRFYLLNPEYDPDTRYRNSKRRPRHNDRTVDSFKRRRREESEHSRRSSVEEASFDVDLYDDDGGQKAKLKRKSSSRRQSVDLFANKDRGRLRDRSASPVADGDGRYGFKEEHPYRRTAKRRSESPQQYRIDRSPRRTRELFPDSNGSSNQHATGNASKELFPVKRDTHPSQVADLMSRSSFTDSAPPKRDLFSRVTNGPTSNANKDLTFSSNRNGRLRSDDHDREGFSILGASKDRPENPLVKELFPMKMQSNNSSKELFDGRVKGRANQRRRAEDLF